MRSGDASRIVQCNLGIFDSFRLLSIKNGRGFPRTLCGVTCFWFDLVTRQLLRQERVMSVMDELNSSELIQTRTRYSFSSEKLVIFENEPLSKHWRIALIDLSKTVTLFNEMMQNWLLRNMVWIHFHFLILISINAPRSDWWVYFVVEYISTSWYNQFIYTTHYFTRLLDIHEPAVIST